MKKVAFICVHNSCRSQIAEAHKLVGSAAFECADAMLCKVSHQMRFDEVVDRIIRQIEK